MLTVADAGYRGRNQRRDRLSRHTGAPDAGARPADQGNADEGADHRTAQRIAGLYLSTTERPEMLRQQKSGSITGSRDQSADKSKKTHAPRMFLLSDPVECQVSTDMADTLS